MTHAGWKNYQTWNYALWLNNDQGLYNYKQELIRQAQRSRDPVNALADSLKEFIQDSQPELQGLYSDLLQFSIDSIDFFEIAQKELED